MERGQRIQEMKRARQHSTQALDALPLSPPPKPRNLPELKESKLDRLNELKKKKELLEEKKKKQLEKRKAIKKKLEEDKQSNSTPSSSLSDPLGAVEEEICDPLLSPRNSAPPQPQESEEEPKTTEKNGVGIKELSPATVTSMINQFCTYLAVIVYSDGQVMAECSLSRVHELDRFFKWNDGRRVFASSLVMLLQKVSSFLKLLLILDNLFCSYLQAVSPWMDSKCCCFCYINYLRKSMRITIPQIGW